MCVCLGGGGERMTNGHSGYYYDKINNDHIFCVWFIKGRRWGNVLLYRLGKLV